MAWHVDYWDYLGWEDPYGSERFTERQRGYADVLGSGVYTPQMVVNGEDEFVGSRDADGAIDTALDATPSHGVWLGLGDTPADGDIAIDYHVQEPPAAAELHLVVVQSGLSNTPTSGENNGTLLEHDNVVRRWKTVPAGTGQVSFGLPSDGPRRFRVIAWLQNPNTLRMRGAALLPIDRDVL